MPDTQPAIAVLKPDVKVGGALSGRGLAGVSLDDLDWPIGRPERCVSGRIGDLTERDHVIGFVQNLSLRRPAKGINAKVSVVLAEPAAIHGAYQAKVAQHSKQFHRILSYNDNLLATVHNGIFFPYGSTWIGDWRKLDLSKTRMCSLIASTKRSMEGHMLRHAVAEWSREQKMSVDLLGREYAPFETKADGVAPYRYSVVIENVRERNLFTEKLLDTVLCQTVPIYWGCPNIGDFMDTSGMILCENRADIEAALKAMSEDDYAIRVLGLRAAEAQAGKYADLFERAARAVAEDRPVP